MPASFLTLPRELRDKIYELCLLREEPVDPWNYSDSLEELSLGLIVANRAINSEAGPVLYGNHFDFTTEDPAKVPAFLERIGRNNAAYVRHVIIQFPYLQNLRPGSVSIMENDSLILASIQESCTGLRTLTMSRHSVYNVELKLDVLDDPDIVAKALAWLNTRLKAILSLREIIVETYEDGLSDYAKRQVENYGWTVNSIENIGDLEYSDDDDYFAPYYDDDELDFYESDNDHDNYDIDYDSDFWRRAAD